MGHITVTEQIAAPVDVVFAFVDDHTNTTRYMRDLTKWAPVGSKSHGKGAHFEVAMKAGPMTLSSIVDITTWTANKAIGWASLEGFKQTGTWRFAAAGAGSTATFEMAYELPGGIAGRVLSRAAEPIVRSNIEKSVKALKTQVEASQRSAPGRGAKPTKSPAGGGAATPAKKSARPAERKSSG